MNILKSLITLWAVILLLPGCSESLEDTYEEWSGDGRLRYPAKCYDLEIAPGWERLTVNWKNGTDVMVKNIKLSWSTDERQDSVLLAPTDTFFDIRGLNDGAYQVNVQTVTEDGRSSLGEMNYGRPYTYEHEMVRTFPTGIAKFYTLTDENIFVYFTNNTGNANILEMKLHYTDLDGKPVKQDVWISGDEGEQKTYYVVGDMRYGESDSIYISRVGLLDECSDTIYFKPLMLNKNERSYTSNFKTAVLRRYGLTDQTEAQKIAFDHFIDTVRILEFDYDMFSFEDILYCKNLKRIVLGKNRYCWENGGNVVTEPSTLYEVEQSVNILKTANDLRGVTIEQYNNHYSELNRGLASMITPMGNPELPELTYVTGDAIEVFRCSERDPQGFDSHLEYLFDNDPDTKWSTYPQGDLRTYEVMLEFKGNQMIRGFEIRQGRDETKSVRCYYPNQIIIEVSKDQISWENATFVRDNLLGIVPGERTLLYMTEPSEVRYVKITVNDQTFISNSSLVLADIVPFR